MTNFEYYKEQLLSLANNGLSVGLIDDNPVPCRDIILCRDCQFRQGDIGCSSDRMKWLYAEHVEKPKLTKQEKAFLEVCRPDCYIARDDNGSLYVYVEPPHKAKTSWIVYSRFSGTSLSAVSVYSNLNNGNFSFIKWEDKEPWKVEDLLKLEVEDE